MQFDGPLLSDRWRLGEPLRAGGQGRTYLARDEHYDGRVVVVKKLVLAAEDGWKKFDLFEREARILGELDHPGIPAFLDHFEGEPGSFYLVMHRARGDDLRAAMGSGGLAEPELRDILRQVLDIAAYLHDRSPPVIHRDIKPANLVRDAKGHVSLVDFGGVRAALREQGGSTVVGTFGYMAPEQLHGQAVAATDLFGIGATIAALASAIEPEKLPRRGLRMDLRAALPGLSPALLALLERMTDPDPDARPQSAAEVLRALGEAPPPRQPRAATARRRAAPPSKPRGRHHADGDTGDDLALPLDLDVPPALRTVIAYTLWAFAGAGWLGLAALRAAILPIVFTVVSAFTGPGTRAKLRGARDRTYAALDTGRDGFRRLQRAALASPRQLPPRDENA